MTLPELAKKTLDNLGHGTLPIEPELAFRIGFNIALKKVQENLDLSKLQAQLGQDILDIKKSSDL